MIFLITCEYYFLFSFIFEFIDAIFVKFLKINLLLAFADLS